VYALRKWSVRHARFMESVYGVVERALLAAAPVLERIGHERLEKPVAAVERVVKGALFDCRMCGQCALSSTGMSCPMNCPKTIRNGPCGGVRPDGNCEVKPEMRCVWVEGWAGAQRMKGGDAIRAVQFAVDHRLQGSSSWLRVVREKTAAGETSEKALGNVVPVRSVNAAATGDAAPTTASDPEIAHTGTDGRRSRDPSR